MKALTKRQSEVLEFIKDYRNKNRDRKSVV